jgi:hypothetical protein
MSTDHQQIAIDTGFSDVKVQYGDSIFKFPTAIARLREVAVNLGITEECYQFKKNRYRVGTGALHDPNILFHRSTDYMITYAPLLVAHALDQLNLAKAPVSLAVCLPIEDYDLYKGEFRESLSAFEINDRKYTFKHVKVYPQSVGALADFITSFPTARSQTGCVFDIGFNTVNALRFVKGQAVKEGSLQFNRFGISLPLEELETVVRRIRRFDFGLVRTNDIFKRGLVPGDVDGQTDVRALMEPIMKNYVYELISKLLDSHGRAMNESDRLIVCGGGAHYLQEFMPEEFKAKLFIPTDPEYANVRGYYKLAGITL